MSGDRDLQLGDAINALPVPPRDDEFMTDLERRLEVADAEREQAGTVAHQRPPSGWSTRRRRQWALVAAAVAAIVMGMALFGPGRGAEENGVGPEPATAARIIRSSLAATGGGRTLRGVVLAGVVRGGRFQVNVREHFIVSDDGSVAIRGRAERNGGGAPLADYLPGTTLRAAYDASARVVTYVWHFSAPQRASVDRNGKVRRLTFSDQAVISRHLAAGPPANSPLDEELPLARLRANMLQLVAGGSVSSATVRDVVVDGRPAWSISTTQLAPGTAPVPPGTPVTLVIDKATRLPVIYRWVWVGSRPHQVFELRFEDFVVGGEVSPGTFTVRVPAHAWITPGTQDFSGTSSQGYRTIDYQDAHLLGATIGWQPAFPSWMPAGFRLASSTYLALPTWKPAGGKLQPEPDSASVSLAYRRGLDAVYVSSSLANAGSGSFSSGGKTFKGHFDDPFVQSYGPGWRYLESRTHDVRLDSGPFAGEIAHVVVDPSILPHLWVTNGGNTATVSGYLSSADMVRVVESLRRGAQLAAASPSATP
jgi:hypothetical protein